MRVFLKDRRGAALTALGLIFATPAFAQAVDPQEAQAVGDVVITGTRIANPNLESNSPITTVSGEVLRSQGFTNVEAVINQLPQIKPGLGSQTNDNANGTATADLRGLGANRTLVLVNGRRVVPSEYGGTVDLNNININLVERVEVVTGGASAVYGSDALGGVVNFILKQNFDGVQLDARGSLSGEGDAGQYNLGVIAGRNFADGRGNVTVSLDYFHRSPLHQTDRDFYAIDRVANGSGVSAATLITNAGLNPTPGGAFTFNAAGAPRPFVNSLPQLSNGAGDRYNTPDVAYLTTPQDRYLVNLLGRYSLNDRIEAYAEGFYIDNTVTTHLSPVPASTNLSVSPLSPVLSASARALLAQRPDPTARASFQRRFTELGPREQEYRYKIGQATVGARGSLNDNWSYDLSYAYGRTESTRTFGNGVSTSHLISGVDGCPAGSPAGCVPVDIFTPGGLTAGALDYIRLGDIANRQVFERHNVLATISGSLFTLPAGSIDTAFGFEYRRDAAEFKPAAEVKNGDLIGFQKQQPVSGHFDSVEVFGEARVPLVRDKPFVHYAGLEFGARYSEYSSVGELFTYKAGGEWAPVADLRFRGLYQRASRAPSVFELFQAGDTNYPTITDPCARILPTGAVVPVANITASIATICQIQGLADPRTTVFTQLNGSVEALSIGNPDLREETSDTFTLGFVARPRFAPGLTLSVDYYDTKVEDYITRLAGGVANTVALCFASGVTTRAQYDANVYCGALGSRLPTGEISPASPYTNSGVLKTQGVDIEASYRLNLAFLGRDADSLSLNAAATYSSLFSLDGVEYQGLSTSTFGTLPEWTSNLRATWTAQAWEASLNLRRVGSVVDRGQSTGSGTYKRIDAEHYLDASLRFPVGEKADFQVGVRNIFDNEAPFIGTGYRGANSDIALYDAIGRVFFASASKRF